MRYLIDAHLDLAWNGVSFDRDLTLELADLRRDEAGMDDVRGRGRATVTFPELRRAGMAVAIATLLARSGPRHDRQRGYQRTDLDHVTRAGAYSEAHAQLAWYHLMHEQGHVRILNTRPQLESHWEMCCRDGLDAVPLGIVLSMEGTDPIVSPDQAQQWWQAGLRLLGLSHYGFGHHAAGTAVDGPLTAEGRELLGQWEQLGGILDVTHLSDTSFREALDAFTGPLIASHHNCRALVPGDRQLTDDQIHKLIQRDAVIGTALDAWMLYADWERGVTQPEVVSLEAAADHIDHICQLAGNTRHAAIGSDLDGGFGTEQTPRDLDTVADLRKLETILQRRNYTDEDLDRIFFGNWRDRLLKWLPA